jgi:hypothetical protein
MVWGLAPQATELANLLAERIRKLPPAEIERMLAILKAAPGTRPPRRRPAGARRARAVTPS